MRLGRVILKAVSGPAPAPQGAEDGVRAARAGTAQERVSMYNDYALYAKT